MTVPDQPSDLLERLRQGDNDAFGYLYRTYYRGAAAFVKANSGADEDARDVFQEALLALFKKTRDSDFRLDSDPGGFLYATVRNLWLYRLRARRHNPETTVDDAARFSGANDPELPDLEQRLNDRHLAVQQLLGTLKAECQKLIEYAYYFQYSTAEIASRLGYAESFIKVKKHRCMAALREKVKKHAAFYDEI